MYFNVVKVIKTDLLLVKHIKLCRYPQGQSKDLIKWLQKIPNPYLHFGDFDFAGIGIYLHEYKRFLLDRAHFFIPSHLETLIAKVGSRRLYDVQKISFKFDQTTEPALLRTIELIHKYKKGLEQEALILYQTIDDLEFYEGVKQI
ncbi:hypothetical protein [Pedobacter immunditicola]|uniref:hypothetical protein n=1 Tax=Pedobacter immunditicola TaxID=3133440 RepID=UPI0030995BD4